MGWQADLAISLLGKQSGIHTVEFVIACEQNSFELAKK
jgi:hypothetical protein